MVTLLIYLSPVNLTTSSRKSQKQGDISQAMRLSCVTWGELSLPLQSSSLNFGNSRQLTCRKFWKTSVPLACIVIPLTSWRNLWNVMRILSAHYWINVHLFVLVILPIDRAPLGLITQKWKPGVIGEELRGNSEPASLILISNNLKRGEITPCTWWMFLDAVTTSNILMITARTSEGSFGPVNAFWICRQIRLCRLIRTLACWQMTRDNIFCFPKSRLLGLS